MEKKATAAAKKWGASLLLLMVFPLLTGQAPFGPSLNTWERVEEGFEVLSRQIQGLPFQAPFKLHALRLDLARFPLRIMESRDFAATHLPIRDLARKYGALGGINGGFFMPGYRPLGLLIVDGRETNPLRNADWGLFTVRDGVPGILHTKDYIPDKNISLALQVGPRLVVKGRELTMKKQVARRSAVGITYQDRVVLVNTENSEALAQDLARVFWLSEDEGGLNCRDAMALDGGPSAQMFVDYRSLKIDISGGWGIPNGLGIFKK